MASFSELMAGRWEITDHRFNREVGDPSCFYIMSRHGKRKDDRSMVSSVVTYTTAESPDANVKIEVFRKIAQKICDDHNALLPDNGTL